MMSRNWDFEDTVGNLSTADTNSSIELIEYSLNNGLIVVGYTLLNALIKVTVSFNNELSDSSKHLSVIPSKGNSMSSRSQLATHLLSYKKLRIDGISIFLF